MVTTESLNQYPELIAFLNAENSSEIQHILTQLSPTYILSYDLNTRRAFNFNPSIGNAFSILEIAAMFGKQTHVNILLSTNENINIVKAARCAAYNGHDHIIRRLLLDSVDIVDRMTLDYAVSGGHTEVVHTLLTCTNAHNYINSYIMLSAILNFKDKTLEQLIQFLSYQKINELFNSENVVRLLLSAVRMRHQASITHLLNVSRFFALQLEEITHDNIHSNVYNNYIVPFVKEKIQDLIIKITNMPQVLWHNDNEKCLYFYLLKFIIKNPISESQEELVLLLSQPEFKELAHQEITPGIKNELLKLALNTNNLKAEFILIMIDQIKQHAIEHNFYDNPQAIQRHLNRKMIIKSGYISILFLRSNLPIASIFLQHGLSYLLPHTAQSISFKQRMFSKAIEFNQKSINNNAAVVIESSPFGAK